jgi:peptidoglycan/LPS O-acetylase OafA/YrhL
LVARPDGHTRQRELFFRLFGISADLHMLHWPLLVFAAWYFANRTELGHIGHLLVVALIVVLCLALYKWVEAPLTAKLRTSLFQSAPRRRNIPIRVPPVFFSDPQGKKKRLAFRQPLS